jgi:hypothetical protein
MYQRVSGAVLYGVQGDLPALIICNNCDDKGCELCDVDHNDHVSKKPMHEEVTR